MTTLDKIEKLIGKLGDVQEKIDYTTFDIDERDDHSQCVDLYYLNSKERRLIQKLRKQMVKFLKETDSL